MLKIVEHYEDTKLRGWFININLELKHYIDNSYF